MPFVNQQNGQKGYRKYFMINLQESYVAEPGLEFVTMDLQSDSPLIIW